MAQSGRIRIGIGGWDYAPWRKTFYPPDVSQKRQLEYASRRVTSIEVNGTFYRLQTPATFAKWRDETPDDFVFALKASRFITNRRELARAGEGIERFIGSGITQLGTKLGPILWQFAPTKAFDAEDLEAFLQLLPTKADGHRLRHALEVRHDSFARASFIELARRYNVGIVLADSDKYPALPDITADFVYVRLMNSVASCVTGYEKKALATWAQRATIWASGGTAKGLKPIIRKPADSVPRDVFLFVINGAKERAPGAAMRLLSHLGAKTATAVRESPARRKVATRESSLR